MKRELKRTMAIIGMMAISYVVFTGTASACRRRSPFSMDELWAADVIVRARAENYVGMPPDAEVKFRIMTIGADPPVQIEFAVEEVLRGEKMPEKLKLYGYLSNEDDYNDQTPPYTFVRRNGRSGGCIANTYKQGASFLLFLKKTKDGYTSNISALGPSNEQLRGDNDEWLLWTRRELKLRDIRKTN